MPRLEEVFNTKELINYFKERQVATMLGESLFPERKIQDIEFDMILGRVGYQFRLVYTLWILQLN